jgi:hypothetical protein
MNGFFYGKGVFKYSDGSYYDGEYRNTLIHKKSHGTFPVCDGKKHGFGVRVYVDGTRYEGQWEEEKMNGIGTLVTPSGVCYRGEFKDNFK